MMWRWCHWFPALVGSCNAKWLESAGKCLAVWNTNALVSERQLRRKRSSCRCLSPLRGGRADLETDWLAEWVAGWISRDGHVRSELSHTPMDWACPGLRLVWQGKKTHYTGKKTDKKWFHYKYHPPCSTIFWGGWGRGAVWAHFFQ